MSRHETGRESRWEDLRQDRLALSPAAAASYRRTRRALELGGRIRALREGRGLSQAELARRMGTTQPAVARMEAGRVTPGLDTLDRVADALDVELAITFHDPAQQAQASGVDDHSAEAPAAG